MRRLLFVTLISATVAMTAAAASSQPAAGPDVAERARRAAHVVVATVRDAQSVFGVNAFGDQLILTNALIQIDETIKGPAATAMMVTVEGGTVGELTLNVSDMPGLSPGEHAVFFLDRTPAGTFVPNGRGRGIVKLDADNRVKDGTLTLEDLKAQIRTAVR
jgi:hypothetical protein